MAASKTGMLLRKAKYIQQREGWLALARRASLFFIRSIFDHQTYYIYENQSDGKVELTPKVKNLTFKAVSTTEEFDRLLAEGFDISSYLDMKFDLDVEEIKRRIDRGATLFCAFVGKEIAYVSWIAFTEQARRDIDVVHCAVNYESEACGGGAETMPKYRNLGLHTLGIHKRCQFARERGLKLKFTVLKSILAAHEAHSRAGSTVCGGVDYWKFFSREAWREKPVRQNPWVQER